jgi:nicotinamidase/pyrazinamidase
LHVPERASEAGPERAWADATPAVETRQNERIRDIMLDGPLVFVDIDTQRDFLLPTGALFVRGSAEIMLNLERLTRFARRHEIPVLATACSHTPDDPELTIFPPHCMAGSEGQKRVAETEFPDSVILEVNERLAGDIPRHLTLLKRELDVFSRPDADALIARYDQTRPTFVVYGVATDYCVGKAVDGLVGRQCRVAVVADAVRGIDAAAEASTLTTFVQRGATLTITERVTRLFVHRGA